MTALTLGIIGCGGITAFAHLPALRRGHPRDVSIAYLCDRKLDRARLLSERFELATTCTDDPAEVLGDPRVDAVIVASSPASHGELGQAAIAAKKHALLQKPLALTREDAASIAACAAATDRNILALPMVPDSGALAELRRLILSGSLGSVRFARIRTSVPGPRDYFDDVAAFFRETSDEPSFLQPSYAGSAGCIADMGPYALTTYHYLFGPGTLIWAHRRPSRYEESALLVLAADSGAESGGSVCSVELGWNQVQATEICTVFGSEGSASIETTGALSVFSTATTEAAAEGRGGRQPILPLSPTDAQDEWVDAVRHGRRAAFHDSVSTAAWVATTIADAYGFSAD